MANSETLIMVCEICAKNGVFWQAQYQSKVPLTPNNDYNLVQVVDNPKDLRNHHLTVRSYSSGHGQFVILDGDYFPIATLRISTSSQTLSTDQPTLTSAGYKVF